MKAYNRKVKQSEDNSKCRLCLKENSKYINAFHTSVNELIVRNIDISFEKDDGLPTNICESCISFLKEIEKFKRICIESDRILRNERCQSDIADSGEHLIKVEYNTGDGNSDLESTLISEEADSAELEVQAFRRESLKFELFAPELSNNGESSTNYRVKDEAAEQTPHSEKSDPLTMSTSFSAKADKNNGNSLSLLRRMKVKACANSYKNKNTALGKKSENGLYKCLLCGNEFYSERPFKRHVKQVHGQRKYSCNECGRSFKEITCLKRHLKIHGARETFQCTICGKSFAQKAYLKIHYMQHKKQVFACDICGKKLQFQSGLSRHKAAAHFGRNYQCRICKFVLTDASALKRHVRAIHSQVIGDAIVRVPKVESES